MVKRLRRVSVDERLWSLERMERVFAADGADAFETRAASFVLYVDQLFNLNTRYNRQRRLNDCPDRRSRGASRVQEVASPAVADPG